MHTLTLTDRELVLVADLLVQEVSVYEKTLDNTKWSERDRADYVSTRSKFREISNLEERVAGIVNAAIDAGHKFPNT
jgi:hypothetical protein